ncbi:hypothetical protein ACT009_05535 [Sphingomonas sp. Tas61C01]|uniref:hypothetical protein n=1 Tax=Sphingomonas sp. Tas61C01 TaxID=3458297 RepID=UPI00403E3D10
MLGAIVFTYGMLASFVLSGASRNRKMRRPNPPILAYVGYVLCGLSGGLALMLFVAAFTTPEIVVF